MNWLKRIFVAAVAAVALATAAQAEDIDKVLSGAEPAEASPADKTATVANDRPQLTWIEGLKEGQQQALVDRKPMLVRVGGSGCPFCKLLDKEIAKPDVQKALNGWTLVYVSIDNDPEAAERLGVAGIPALRLRTVTGLPVADHDGFMAADKLIQWLDENHELARATPDAVLLSSDPPTAIDIVKLTRQFGSRNAAVREAAIGRLKPHAQMAAGAVVRRFEGGNLATRLTALELLREWQAPIEDVDPWRSETLSEAKLAALTQWASGLSAEPSQADANVAKLSELTGEQLIDIHDQLDRMLKAEPQEAAAIRDRLARFGQQIRDAVLHRLRNAETDESHQRLLTLRYRLVAPDSLVLRWPGGLERLAATDNRQRHAAAEQLVTLATDAEQPLLQELFSDPDPLVREISLRGLQQLGSTSAQESMVRLLNDPEPNVRAAVLKQFAENPTPKLVPKVAEYVAEEEDADLVVHAIRFFRQAKGTAALESMLSLLDHESWRVRAEAAEGVGELNDSDLPEKLQAKSYAALIQLLNDEDGFVVSRAVKGLQGVALPAAVQALVNAADRHPDLLVEIIGVLSASSLSNKSEVYLRKFVKHERPDVRATAVKALSDNLGDGAGDVIQHALSDDDSDVRIAAAEAAYELLDNLRPDEDEILGLNDPYSEPYTPRPSIGARILDWFSEGAKKKAEQQKSADPPAEDNAGKDAAEDAIERAFDSIELELEGKPAPPPQERPNPPVPPIQPPKPLQPEARDEAFTDTIKAAREAELDVVEAAKEAAADAIDSKVTEPAASVADEDQPAKQAYPWDDWLIEFHGDQSEPKKRGQRRTEWVEPMIEPLQEMLAASSPHERCVAAVVLTAVGGAEQALPVLSKAAREDASTIHSAARALKWLTWDKRLPLFEQLMDAAVTDTQRQQIIYVMREIPDDRAIAKYWEALADPNVGPGLAQALQAALISSYSGRRWNNLDEAPAAAKQQALQAAKVRATAGPELQRVAALGILTYLDPKEAQLAARANLDDPQSSDQLRADSFQVLLTTSKKYERLATEALAGKDSQQRDLALRFLVYERRGFYNLRGFDASQPILELTFTDNRNRNSVEAPEGLKASTLRPLLNDPDPEVAAQAAYLLAILGEGDGLPQLISHWRANYQGDDHWTKLVYRAVAALDDSRQLPVLQDIYRQLDEYEVSDFYWTIRIMTGPEILRFRKQIRDTVGMDNLQ